MGTCAQHDGHEHTVYCEGRVEPATIVAGMTGEGAAMACVLSVGVFSASDFGGGNEK